MIANSSPDLVFFLHILESVGGAGALAKRLKTGRQSIDQLASRLRKGGRLSQLRRRELEDLDRAARHILADFPGEVRNRESTELKKAIHLVRQLYGLKTNRPPRREHDWRVLMALLKAPPQRNREERGSPASD